MKIINHSTSHVLQLTTPIFPINCYIVKEENYCTLIDCSKSGTAKSIIQAVEETQLPLKYIILTHAHSDHTGDIQKISAHFPDAEVCIGKKEYIDSQNNVHNIRMPIEPKTLLSEGESIGSLLVRETPGHTNGSISLIDQRTHTAYVGDLLQSQGGLAISGDIRWLFPFPAMATVDKQLAIESVKQLCEKETLQYIFCGHGPVTIYSKESFARLITRAQKK
ncbi:MBL fold metallo-hydrolase [Enterococcus larvae]|uniref:MBL fold metallo-hydrolase n=1 Tax=Enterococcus larvae TaxID=2794352 RepID=UPI003F3E7B62